MDVFRVRKIREAPSGGQTTGTLDSVHRDVVQTLRDLMSTQDERQREVARLKAEISELYATNTMEAIVQATHLQAKVRELETEDASNPVEDYYMKNADLLLDYYKRQEPTGVQQTTPRDASTFLKFFANAVPGDSGPTRKQMFEEYVQRMKLSAGPEMTQQMTEHCLSCNVAREEIPSEGILVCPRCGSEEYALVVSDFPSFRDPPKERNNYAYKKINHLNEILNQFQAKESTIIPEEVMNEVILELKKRRIENVADLSEEDIRQILKKLGRS